MTANTVMFVFESVLGPVSQSLVWLSLCFPADTKLVSNRLS